MSDKKTAVLCISGNEWLEQGREHYARGEYDQAIVCCEMAVRSADCATPGRAWNSMGWAWARKQDYDKAIDCYRKAIETPGFDAEGYAWNNMGWAYADKGDHDNAIACYRKALLSPGFESPGGTWNNLGLVLAEKGLFDDAVEAYRSALKSPGYATPGNAWTNLAVALMRAGRFEDAAAACTTALSTPGFDACEVVFHTLGEVHSARGDFAGAIESWNRAITLTKQKGRTGFAQLIESRVAETRSRIGRAPATPRDPVAAAIADVLLGRAARQADGATRDGHDGAASERARTRRENLAAEVTGIMDRNQGLMEGYCRPPDGRRPAQESPHAEIPENSFINLKGWSSNVPLVAEIYRDRFGGNPLLGGGYFMDWRGKGIVVDPGINFVDNFHRHGGHIARIGFVIVTHGHIDHAHDLATILDLQREYNKLVDEGKITGNRLDILYLLDRDTYHKSQDQLLAHLPAESQRELTPGEQYDEKRLLEGTGLRIRPFHTAHDTRFTPNSVGLILEFFDPDNQQTGKPFRLGISSDTGLTDEVLNALSDCDAVIAHFNKTNQHDLLGTDIRRRHKHHLGYMGVREVFRASRAGLCVAAEWSGEHGDIRFQLAELLKLDVGRPDRAVLPADIGLSFSIPAAAVRCQACGGRVPASQMIVARPNHPFGSINYYCPDCLGGPFRG